MRIAFCRNNTVERAMARAFNDLGHESIMCDSWKDTPSAMREGKIDVVFLMSSTNHLDVPAMAAPISINAKAKAAGTHFSMEGFLTAPVSIHQDA